MQVWQFSRNLVTKTSPLAEERGRERRDRGGDSGGEKVSRERISRDSTDGRLPALTCMRNLDVAPKLTKIEQMDFLEQIVFW